METIKIAFCNRPSYDSPLGGDAIQMLQTKQYLEDNFDVQIDIITDYHDITTKYSLVHVFNFLTYKVTRTFINQAKQLGIPVVSSCIYWDYSFASTGLLYKIIGYPSFVNWRQFAVLYPFLDFISYIFSKPVGISRVFKRHVREFILKSDVIAPNSIEEGRSLLHFAGLQDESKLKVVFNGVSLNSNVVMSEIDFFQKYKIPHNYILQVGRIEFLKNQLNIVYALKDNPEIPIVFIGENYDRLYVKKINALAKRRGNVYFLGKIPHEDIASFYKYAALHVLLSLRESPGLVSLEACALNCPIVIATSQYLPLNTYFPGAPYVADPLNIADIRQTILNAYSERKPYALDVNRFSWRNVAEQTYNIYKDLLHI